MPRTTRTSPVQSCNNPVNQQYDIGQHVGLTGTPMILSSDGAQLGGYIPPEQLRDASTSWPPKQASRTAAVKPAPEGSGRTAGGSRSLACRGLGLQRRACRSSASEQPGPRALRYNVRPDVARFPGHDRPRGPSALSPFRRERLESPPASPPSRPFASSAPGLFTGSSPSPVQHRTPKRCAASCRREPAAAAARADARSRAS